MSADQLDEIFAQTLTGDYDDESPWNSVRKLHNIGSREIFDRAASWCRSDKPLERARGADVLAQLGVARDHPQQTFPDEAFSVLAALAKGETDPLPLMSALYALGHIGNPLTIPLAIGNQYHATSDVRCAVAYALGCFANDERAVKGLLALMQDEDADVRDWATFGVGVLCDLDSETIRDALNERIADPNRDVREESLVGLAKRQDRRALPALVAELNEAEISKRITDAAESFLPDGEDCQDWHPDRYVGALKKRFSL